MIKKFVLGAMLVSTVSACAQKAEKIEASYVSPLLYEDFSCRQVAQEAARVSSRANELVGVQDRQAKNDATATAVSLILFWPAAFFIKGDRETAGELSRLKGEMDALEAASIKKGCDIQFRTTDEVETEVSEK